MIFYHMTPERNIKRILQEGLVPGRPKSLASAEELTSNAIFLGRSIEECRSQLNLFGGSEPGIRVRRWAVFEVRLPQDCSVEEDEFGYLYTTKPILPKFLRVVWRDSELFGILRKQHMKKKGGTAMEKKGKTFAFTKAQCEELAEFFDDYTAKDEDELTRVKGLSVTFHNAKPIAGWEVSKYVGLEFKNRAKIDLIELAIECLWGEGDE